MRIEHHGQGFSAALRVPEHAAFTVGFLRNPRLLNGLAHSEVLMIACQHLETPLPAAGKENEVLQNIQQALLLKHALIKGIELGIGVVFIAAVLRLPLHEAIQPRGDGACLVGGEVADDTNRIVVEHGGDVLHVIADLAVCVFYARFVLRWAFQLHQHQRKAVDKEDDVRAAIVPIFNERELIDHIKCIQLRMRIVNQPDDGGALLTPNEKLDRNAILQIVCEDGVFLNQAAALEAAQL